MARTSDNLNLIIPEQTDFYDVGVHETNYEKIDEEIGGTSTNLANLQQEVTTHLDDINPHAETANRTIYVGANREFKTINSAISTVKKNLGEKEITILFDEGTYNANLHLNAFYQGKILIKASGDVANTVINGSVYVRYNLAWLALEGFTINTGSAQNAITIERSYNVEILKCVINGLSTHAGVYGSYNNAQIRESTINNAGYVIRGFACASMSSLNNAGTGNNVVFAAYDGATIATGGTSPAGTTTKVESTGGVVRP